MTGDDGSVRWSRQHNHWLQGLAFVGALVLLGLTLFVASLFQHNRRIVERQTTTTAEETQSRATLVAEAASIVRPLPSMPVPRPAGPITPQNASQVVELGRWGKGPVVDLAWSPDGRLIAVASPLGIYFYDSQSLAEVRHAETAARVWSVEFSPDGQYLATLGPRTLQWWRVQDGELLHTVEGEVDSVAFSPAGQVLASGGQSSVQLWRVTDGALLRTLEFQVALPGEGCAMAGLTFSPDGRTLAARSSSFCGLNLVGLWRVEDAALLYTLELPDGHGQVTISPDGQTVAYLATFSTTLHLWRLEQGLPSYMLEGGWREDLVFSPDGQTLASAASMDSTVHLWWVADGTLRDTLDGGEPRLGAIAFSPNGLVLAVGTSDVVQLWRVEDGVLLRTLKGPMLAIDRLAFSPDGQVLVGWRGYDSAWLWRTADGMLLGTLQQEGHSDLLSVTFSPDGQTLAGAAPHAVQLWRVSDGAPLVKMEGIRLPYGLSFSPDGQILALGSEGAHLRRTVDGTLLRTLEENSSVIRTAFSPDGQTLATVEGSVKLWRTADGMLLYTLLPTEGKIRDVAFSPDGQILATAGGRGYYDDYDDPCTACNVCLWRAADGTLLRTLEGYTNSVWWIAFSPDGQTLASTSGDSEFWLWRLADEPSSQVVTLPGEDRRPSLGAVAFSPDSQILATGGDALRLWRVADGALLCTLTGPRLSVASISFSADGSLLVSGSGDGTVRYWGIKP